MSKSKRNGPCPCGRLTDEGKPVKFKKCCGAIKFRKQELVYHDIRSFYNAAQRQAQDEFVYRWGFHPDPSQLIRRKKGHEAYAQVVISQQCMLTPLNATLWELVDQEKFAAILHQQGALSAVGD